MLMMQTFLEQNEGPGLQHLALKTDDIFHTLRELRRRSDAGGFDFMPPASDAYYRWAWARICVQTCVRRVCCEALLQDGHFPNPRRG